MRGVEDAIRYVTNYTPTHVGPNQFELLLFHRQNKYGREKKHTHTHMLEISQFS